MDESETSRELKEYLETHKVHELFTRIVEELLKTRPSNPLQAIADYLQSEFGVHAVGGKQDSPRHAEVIEDYHESEGEDDDDEEVAELPKAHAAVSADKSRRTSVSAGVINLASAQKHTAPVFSKTPVERERIMRCITASALFKECDGEALATICNAFEKCSYQKGAVIIKQGDLVAEHFFLLDDGKAEALIGEAVVKKYAPGDSFGELALLYNKPRAATVRASSDAALWRLDQRTFKSTIMVSVTQKRQKYIDFLKRCALMQALDDFEINTLADSLESRVFKKDEPIVSQGDVGNDFFIIEKGNVTCYKDGVPVLNLGSGDYFGELALLYNQSRQATVKVASDSANVLVIDRKTFQRLMGPLGEILKRNPLHAQYLDMSK
jgi:cAMP-dependent protein kinase regulator